MGEYLEILPLGDQTHGAAHKSAMDVLKKNKISFREIETDVFGDGSDQFYGEVRKFALEKGEISASIVQKVFKVGYARAARLVELLEEEGVIETANCAGPRKVLLKIIHD